MPRRKAVTGCKAGFCHNLSLYREQLSVCVVYGPDVSCVCLHPLFRPGLSLCSPMSKKKMMSNSSPDVASRLYALAVARDTANLVDVDAALALARASTRTLMALSPQAAMLMRRFAQEEIDRLSMECTEEAQGSIALIQDALGMM